MLCVCVVSERVATDVQSTMDINLYYPERNRNLLTFTLHSSINSVKIHMFRFAENKRDNHNAADVPDVATPTKTVSGYEKKYRAISMTMAVMKAPAETGNNHKIDGYVISCIRMPYVAAALVEHASFTRPLCVAVVKIVIANDGGDDYNNINNDNAANEIQVWHIFSVKRGMESQAFKKITGVITHNQGHASFYLKELISVRGNVSSAFITDLSGNSTRIVDLELLRVTNPRIQINTEQVIIQC